MMQMMNGSSKQYGEKMQPDDLTHGSAGNKAGMDTTLDWVRKKPYFQAGLAGYSDGAMRIIAREYGCPYCITEALLDELLIRGGRGLKAAELDDADHPIGGQIIGGKAHNVAAGGKLLVKLGHDVIDVNLACPVKKMRKHGRGGALLRETDVAIDILKAVRDAVGDDAPVTVKLRKGYNDDNNSYDAFYQILEAAIGLKYAAATVHARTVEQKYQGDADWNFLKNLTSTYNNEMANGFIIFGSGDVFSARTVKNMIEQTSVSGVAVARGCIGNPWLFHNVESVMSGGQIAQPGLSEQRTVLMEHFEMSMKLHGEKSAGRMMRKFGIKYAQHHPDSKIVANEFIKVKNFTQWRNVIDTCYVEN